MSATKTRLSFLPDFPGRDRLYRPLDAKKMEIRVIIIKPSSERSAPLECSLQTISIRGGKGANQYHALSYYWGSTAEDDRETITVYAVTPGEDSQQGFDVPVTKQLTAALRQFRSRIPSMGHPLVLWTDAVCINQLDANERAQQVTIMRHIYVSATGTWIWLGESDPLAEQGLANLFGLALVQRHGPGISGHHSSNPAESAFDYDDFDVDVDLSRLESASTSMRRWTIWYLGKSPERPSEIVSDVRALYDTIAALCRAPYWSRGWVLQEACANRDLVFHCGRTRCRVAKWVSLRDFVQDHVLTIVDSEINGDLGKPDDALDDNENFDPGNTLCETNEGTCSEILTENTDPLTKWLDQMAVSIDGFMWSDLADDGIGFTFWDPVSENLTNDLETLYYGISCHTTDPRDRVYALPGAMPGFMQLQLKPDYSITTEEVFTRATAAALQATRTWSHVHFSKVSGSPFLPSWAIDFTLAAPVVHGTTRPSINVEADCGASFRLKEIHPGVLLTAGFVYDKVVAASPVFSALDNRTDARMPLWHWWMFLNLNDNQRYISRNRAHDLDTDIWAALCRVLSIASNTDDSDPGNIAKCFQWMLDNQEFQLARNVPSLIGEAYFYRSLRLVVTQKGHIGLAPPAVGPGDCIAVIATGTSPFVLRKVQSDNVEGAAYRLLGACCIDGQAHPVSDFLSVSKLLTCTGIMYGEAVCERALRVFRLRHRRLNLSLTIRRSKFRRLQKKRGKPKAFHELAFLDDICLV